MIEKLAVLADKTPRPYVSAAHSSGAQKSRDILHSFLPFSPRLGAVLRQHPKSSRSRLVYALLNNDVYTLSRLCAMTWADVRRWENVGARCLNDLEQTLAAFGLALTDGQSPAKRLLNATWFRAQIAELVADCDENITEDQELAAKERDDVRRGRYLASVEINSHWKRQLERVLAGKNSAEDLADTLIADTLKALEKVQP